MDGLARCRVVDRDVGVGSGRNEAFGCKPQHAGRNEGRFGGEFHGRECGDVDERKTVVDDDVARNGAAIRADGVDEKFAAGSFLRGKEDTRNSRIHVVEGSVLGTWSRFKPLRSRLSRDEFKDSVFWTDDGEFAGFDGREHAFTVFR